MIEQTMQQVKQHVTAFRVLYFGVALYTLRHSALGFATIEPDASIAWALLAALVVDIGMLLAAEQLRERITLWMVIGLFVSCILSAFSQLLFAATNAGELIIAPGATWMNGFATMLIEWRVVILPLAMPLLVIVYAFASKRVEAVQGVVSTDAEVLQAVPVVASGNGKPKTYKAQVFALLQENPQLSETALQKTVGCRDIRTVRAAMKEWESERAEVD